jgi:alpha amylase-like protein
LTSASRRPSSGSAPPLRAHPHLYEINTWPWLDALSRQARRRVTLGGVPDREWDALRRLGIDIVYLMGIWKRSAIGRELARVQPSLAAAFDRVLPGWTSDDVAGSAYSIAGYEPDARVGSWDELAAVREQLHRRGMQLMVDFIPNHTGFDHPWIQLHPDRYVQADEAAFRRDPGAFRAIEMRSGDVRFVACARDPYFPPWNDVAQLDYSNEATRSAMVAELERLALHADGARCDMAMLVLSDIFRRTWKDHVRADGPAPEFWTRARAAVPGFVLMAEVYWDLEWRLQQLGFDFTYDKRLYDRLLYSPPSDVRAHLTADAEYQRRSVRFIENHDEPRSTTAFGDRVTAAAVTMATLPGLRLFYQGQFEGRTIHLPVQLGRWRDDPANPARLHFYERLLEAVDDDIFHEGDWRLLEVGPAGDSSSADLLAWRWSRGADVRIVAVNLGRAPAQGVVRLLSGEATADEPFAADTRREVVLEDRLDGRRFPWTLDGLRSGLYVRLETGGAHLFQVILDDMVASRTPP